MPEQEYFVLPLEESEAIDLFHARARAAVPDFAANGSVAEICRRLDHLPLAIELAAARVRALPVDEILTHLELRLPFLVGGARDVPDRQRTLRATIAWSYELLSAQERSCFARVGVFAGGFTLETAHAVAEADVDLVQSLVAKSLLRHSDGRYFMLETIREYALERLDEDGESTLIRDRHARYLAERADCRWVEFGSGGTGFREFAQAERRNLAAALEWSLAGGNGADALAIVSGVWSSWSDSREGRRLAERALALDSEPRTERRAHALTALGDLARGLSDLATARHAFEEAVAIFRQLGLPLYISTVMVGLADVALAEGDPAGARLLAEESVRIRREELDSFGLGRPLATLAEIAVAEGELERALELSEEAVERTRVDAPEAQFIPVFIAQAGEIRRRQGDDEGALASFRESLLLGLQRDVPGALLSSLENIAAIWAARGDVERAARLAGAAERSHEASGTSPRVPFDWADDSAGAGWSEGRAMSLAEAAEYALAALS
jgi:tetratricopeptide (TPR) repeat protein